MRSIIIVLLSLVALTLAGCEPGGVAAPTVEVNPTPTYAAPAEQASGKTAVAKESGKPAVVTPSPSPPPPTPSPMPTASPASGAVLLRLKFQPNETRSYSYVADIGTRAPDGTRVDVQMNMRLRYRVVEVHGDGSATMILTFERVAFSANGKTADVPEMVGAALRMRVAPDGKTTDVRVEKAPLGGGNGEANADELSGLSQLMLYPATPLAVGESYDSEFPMSLPGQAKPVVLSSRVLLEEMTKFGGKSAARLTETVSMPDIQIPVPEQPDAKFSARLSGSMMHYVDVVNGWPISGNGELVMDMKGSSAEQQSVNLQMQMKLRYQEER